MDNRTISDLIASLKAEYCIDKYNCHNIHQNGDTIWYYNVDINAIDIHGYY